MKLLTSLLMIFGTCLQLSGQVSESVNHYSTLQEPDDAITFLVVGDWGRHGEEGQADNAVTMGRVAKHLDAAAVVSTGDNFYPDGVASVTDASWETSFEDIYTAHSLHVPWVVSLGNHDYHGNVQAQIDYSQVSKRWTMPSRYFTHTLYEDANNDTVSVLFVVLDTSPFQKDYHNEPDEYSDVAKQDTAAQKRWLDSVLVGRTSTWTIVVGHHPMYSGGKRKGKTADMITAFSQVFARHNVDFYVAGHEHDLQHHDDGSGVHYVVSGAGSEVRPVGNIEHTRFARSVTGFAAFTATLSQLTLRFIDVNGNVIYTFTKSK